MTYPKRIVILDSSTNEPLFVCEGTTMAGYILGVPHGYISKFCSSKGKFNKKIYPFEKKYKIGYAEDWEEENGEYLPGKRIELK